MLASTNIATEERGARLFTIGVAVQLGFIASFIFVTMWADYKLRTQPDKRSQLKLAFRSLYITIILITIRTIYRTAEYETADYTTGSAGYLSSREWCFYMFDTLPILSAFVVYSYWHFVDTLPYNCITSSYLGTANRNQSNNVSDIESPVFAKTVSLHTIEVVDANQSNNYTTQPQD